jgi:integrase
LRALPKPNGQIWYYKKAAGRETLGNVVKNIMKKAGSKGYFTNHSLRRSCATRLYDAGIPEQVIQETTGHRSSDGIKRLINAPRLRSREKPVNYCKVLFLMLK